MDLPERYGGMGVDAVTTGAIIEELVLRRFQCRRSAVVQSLCGAIVEKNGSEQIRSLWLPRVTQGRGDPRPFDHGTACRLGRRRTAVEGRSRRRRLSALRRKDLDDLFGQRRRLPRFRPNRIGKRGRKRRDRFSCSRRERWLDGELAFATSAATCQGEDRSSSTAFVFRRITGSATRGAASRRSWKGSTIHEH